MITDTSTGSSTVTAAATALVAPTTPTSTKSTRTHCSSALGQFTPNDYYLRGVAHIVITDKFGDSKPEVLVDAADIKRVLAYGRWTLHKVVKKSGSVFLYARSSKSLGMTSHGKRSFTYLHRFLLEPPTGI